MNLYFKLCLTFIMLFFFGCTQDVNEKHNTSSKNLVGFEETSYFTNFVGATVFFEANKSDLSERSREILNLQASWLIQNDTYMISIEGYTDEKGTRDYKLALGAERAFKVKAFLISQGVADYRIAILSYGKERPKNMCSNEKCYSNNRRAITVLSN